MARARDRVVVACYTENSNDVVVVIVNTPNAFFTLDMLKGLFCLSLSDQQHPVLHFCRLFDSGPVPLQKRSSRTDNLFHSLSHCPGFDA